MSTVVLDLSVIMTAFMLEPNRGSHMRNKEGNDVREIFYEHWEKMKAKRTHAFKKIQRWRQNTIEETNKYAEEQIRILDEDCDRQRVRFDEERAAKISERCDLNAPKQLKLIEQLLETCRSLKFQVAKVDILKHEMEKPRVRTVAEQIEVKRQERLNKRSPESVNDEDSSGKDNDNSALTNPVDKQ